MYNSNKRYKPSVTVKDTNQQPPNKSYGGSGSASTDSDIGYTDITDLPEFQDQFWLWNLNLDSENRGSVFCECKHHVTKHRHCNFDCSQCPCKRFKSFTTKGKFDTETKEAYNN